MQTSLWTQKYVTMGFRVKPYVHFFNIHLPMSVKILGPQDRFSGELVELKNDSVKKTHLRRTNRKDPAMTLRSQLRIEFHEMKDKEEKFLEERTKKRKAREQHPSVAEGNRLRQKEKRRSEDEERQRLTASQRPYANHSIPELKEVIRTKTGKKTLKRSRDAL